MKLQASGFMRIKAITDSFKTIIAFLSTWSLFLINFYHHSNFAPTLFSCVFLFLFFPFPLFPFFLVPLSPLSLLFLSCLIYPIPSLAFFFHHMLFIPLFSSTRLIFFPPPLLDDWRHLFTNWHQHPWASLSIQAPSVAPFNQVLWVSPFNHFT